VQATALSNLLENHARSYWQLYWNVTHFYAASLFRKLGRQKDLASTPDDTEQRTAGINCSSVPHGFIVNIWSHHIRYNDWVLARFDCPPGVFIAHGSVFHPVLLIYKVKEPNAEKSTGCCIECDASDTEFMIQCDLCLGWCHYVCANVDNCSQATLERMKFLNFSSWLLCSVGEINKTYPPNKVTPLTYQCVYDCTVGVETKLFAIEYTLIHNGLKYWKASNRGVPPDAK